MTLVPSYLQQQLEQALHEPDPVLANLQITRCHYLLAQALGAALGPGAGANFHSWAVWGSRKAGVTIRQEDLDQARRDGSRVGGVVGGLVGLVSGRQLRFAPPWLAAGTLLGVGGGIACGRWLIRRSRSRSASLILAGNRTVLADIGRQTARFVAWLTQPAVATGLTDFLAGIPDQPLLHQAFTHYYAARHALTPADKQAATYLGNCFAVWHEHERLEPYIRGAMPLIIRRCVTQRLLQFDIGARRLAVAHDVPATATAARLPAAAEALAQLHRISGAVAGTATHSAARDWTRIRERMRYVFALFRAFHADPEVCVAPYSTEQLRAIAAGQLPAGEL